MKKVSIIAAIILTTSNFLLGQTAPTAQNVVILGEALYNSTIPDGTILTGDYDYVNTSGFAEGNSTFQWYRNGAAIAGATAIRYTITAVDLNQNITFGVTPVSIEPATGTESVSAQETVLATSYTNFNSNVNVTITTDTHWLNASIKQNKKLTIDGSYTLIIHGDFDLTAGGIIIDLINGATLIVNGQLITENNLRIDVDETSTFEINSGLYTRNNSDIEISGIMTVDGDISVENNATFTVNDGGSLDVTGDVNFDGGGTNTMTINGSLDVGGDITGTASIDGDGEVMVGGSVDETITVSETITGTLPIELTQFTATPQENAISIYWQTASEENNHYFTIERSVDGLNFETIGTVMGAGNSQTTLNYSFTDVNPLSGTTYYRLQQTDFDGKFEIFNMVSVSFYNEGNLKVFPNPASSDLTIDFGGLTAQSQIQIMNLHGQVVKSLSVWESVQTIDVSDLAAGNYLLTIINGNQPIVKRIVIQ